MEARVSEQTLDALKNGDEGALSAIMQIYGPSLYRFALKLLPTREDAEEAVQEVFFRLYRHASTITDPVRMTGWLMSVTKNLCFDRLRHIVPRRHCEETIARIEAQRDNRYLHTHDYANNPLQVVANREMATDILKRLAPTGRTILLLQSRGYTQDEMSKRLRVPQGTVKSRLNFAHVRARAIAKELGYIETA